MADKGNAQEARIHAIMGATGCGKSTLLRKELAKKKRKRTLIWSPKEAVDDYCAFYAGSVLVTTATQVLDVMRKAGSGEFHLVYAPRLNRKVDTAQFDVVCKIAMAARNVTFVGEELHTVTLPSWGPDGWNQLVMIGRGYGTEIFGLSQRPASVDKNFFSNLSSLSTGRLNDENDQKTIAKALRVPLAEVANLSGYQWIRRDMQNQKLTRG